MANSALLIWNRLEGKPRSQNLEDALKAEVRDPLWMLCRQWQFGEFEGEDAATPAFSRVRYQKNYLSQIQLPDQTPQEAQPEVPLNPIIETIPFVWDLSIRLEIGRHWLKLLKHHLPPKEQGTITQAFTHTDSLLFDLADNSTREKAYEHAAELSNSRLQLSLLLARRKKAIDGKKLLELILRANSISVEVIGRKNQVVDNTAAKLLEWGERVYHFRADENPAWHDSRLEYQFDLCTGPENQQQYCLKAKEYTGHELEWYQFDYRRQADNPSEMETPIEETTAIPVQVSYQGMPRTRWWEMEDARINFGNIKTTTDNPARLLFAQFNLIYGNDWFMLPLEVEIGMLTKVESIIVVDNFGFRTKVLPTPSNSRDKWSYFNFHNQGKNPLEENWFYYPNTARDILKGDPVEQVHFMRDEMANMVWGIESIVPDRVSKGVPGNERSSRMQAYIRNLEAPETFEASGNEARYRYQLSNAGTIPENWIPFIPVNIGDAVESRQIQLQRAALPRLVRGFEARRIRPQTSLLSKGIEADHVSAYHIFEEEVPRAGAIVKGRWKRTRWLNGKTFVWFAREKTVGRGEGASQLQFDFLRDKKTE